MITPQIVRESLARPFKYDEAARAAQRELAEEFIADIFGDERDVSEARFIREAFQLYCAYRDAMGLAAPRQAEKE